MRAVSIIAFAAVLAALSSAAITEGAASGAHVVEAFEAFKAKYNRRYATPEEEATRLGHFIRNMKVAEEQRKRNPHATFGATKFADLSQEEFKSTYLRHRPAAAAQMPNLKAKAAGSLKKTQIDWVAAGMVTPVRDQGQCGSPYVYSAIDNIASLWAIAGHGLTQLSAGEIVECDTLDSGCNGGLMENVWAWMLNNTHGGICSAKDYPYRSGNGSVPACHMQDCKSVAYITSYGTIAADENTMAEYVATNGPISVGVDAESWQTYMGGVMTDCTSQQMDHAALATGYNTIADGSTPAYWSLKNSWGPEWGEEGYIRVGFGSNQCDITGMACSSVVQ